MPNLLQIQGLRQKYGASNNVSVKELQALNEGFNRRDIKAFLVGQGVNDHSLAYFENQKTANVIMLFIDITDFSKKCEKFSNQELSLFLDAYYDKVVPIIFRHGGEVEKIMGDGIICVFGEPFLSDTKDKLFQKADACAKDLIIELKGSDKEVKIALHDGNIMYYKNKTANYPEYTMIGKPLTELFRLESVSENNSINYFHLCDFDNKEYSKTGMYRMSDKIVYSNWTKSNPVEIKLKGVSWSYIKHFTCTYRTS